MKSLGSKITNKEVVAKKTIKFHFPLFQREVNIEESLREEITLKKKCFSELKAIFRHQKLYL